MPSIGDITGRIVIQDTGSPSALKFGENLDKISKTITASMSRATLATETAVRDIAAKLNALKSQTKATDTGKGLLSDLQAVIKKRQEEIVALKAGPAAIEALNRKRFEEAQALKIAAAQVEAGISAESDLGKEIAKNIRTLDKYEHELSQVAKAQALAAQKAEQQVAAYRKMSDVGSMLTARVTLPLVGLAAVSFKTSTDLNRSLANVSALLTDLTGNDLNQAINSVKSNIQSLAPELGKSTGDLAEGFYEVVSSLGYTSDSFGQLEIAARAGAAGLATTQESINFLTAVTKTYGDTSETAFKKVADLGFQAVNIGQCVVGSTRVLLADGSYKCIDELQAGATVVSFDGRSFVPSRASWFDSGVKPTVRIITKLGREIETTWSHPYLSIPKEQDPRATKPPTWKPVLDLSPGDKIAVPSALPFFGTVTVSAQEAGLLGLWIAEGSGKSTSPRICSTLYGETIQKWASHFGCKARNVESRAGWAPSWEITAGAKGHPCGNPVQALLKRHGLLGCLSRQKHVPPEVFTWERESLSIFLHWLFNGDGWCSRNKVGFQLGFCSASEILVRDVNHLLLRFGVVGKVRKRTGKWCWETQRREEIERFLEFIGIDRSDAREFVRETRGKQRRSYGTVHYDEIVSIEAGEDQHVYDLTVPKLANFVAEDIIAHNTTFPQLAASIGGVAPVAQAAGVSLEEMFAVIATATGVTGNTSEVTNQMAAAITALLSPSEQLKGMYKELKVNSGEAMIAEYGLVGSLQKVAQYSEAAKIPIIELLGRKEAFIITASLAGAQAKTFAGNLDKMGQAAKANGAIVTDAFDKQTQGINRAGFQYEQAKVKLEVLSQRLGDQLAPAIVKVIEKITSMIEGFSALPVPIKNTLIVVGSLAAAIGPLLFVTGQLLLAWRQIVVMAPRIVASFTSITGAIGLNSLAFQGLVVVGVLLFINKIIDKWGEAQTAVTEYNLEVAKIEGNALAFAQQVSQGALSSTVSKDTFDQKLKEADILLGHIRRLKGEIDNLNADINKGLIFGPTSGIKEKEREYNQLLGVYGKLRTSLAGVTIAGEKVDDTLGAGTNPFAGLTTGGEKATDTIGDLINELARQTRALVLLQDGMDTDRIENLVEAAQELGKVDLFDPLVQKAAALKDGIDKIAVSFKLAEIAKAKFAELGTLDDLIKKQFDKLPAGGNDPEMQKLLATLQARKRLTDATATAEEKRLEAVREALIAGVEGEALQRIVLDNADQWNVELDETQLKFIEISEKLLYIAEGIAHDLVSSWRRAWEENESITDATVDSLRDSFLNVLQDIVSQWLSTWFKAMAQWLARWIATQVAAKTAQAGLGASGSSSSAGTGTAVAGAAAGSGASANTLAGYALAAYALYVVYKGFIEDHKRKFGSITIADGQAASATGHGSKFINQVQEAASLLLKSLSDFTSQINIDMERYGTIILEASKSGYNVKFSPTSTGVLFKSMEEAISYAQVLMLKYGQFADSVSILVRSVIASSKAMTIEQLASDISFARELETQNLEQSAAAIREAMDVAIAQWKRAEELFLGFYDRNLPAFAEAATSILTRLGNSIWAQYNQLAGIEEDPAKAWERKKAQYRAERMMTEAQLKLWKLEIDGRIANFNTFGPWLGGLNNVTRGTLKHIQAWVQAADILDPALQALLDIQALINKTLEELPPIDLPGEDPTKGRGGKGNRAQLKDLREQLMEEIGRLQAEAKGPLHAAFYDFEQSIQDFIARAKEAKLPADELAKGIALLTEAFRKGLLDTARDRAGLDSDFTKRLRDTQQFFDELEALGRKNTGIPDWLREWMEGQALEKFGDEITAMIAEFGGLVDPMLAINMRAAELRQNVLAFAEAAGWSAEQIDAAMAAIEAGKEYQRQQGINSVLDRLFGYLKQAGLFQKEAQEFERQKALTDLALLEAQLRFYGALTEQTQAWIDAAREFVLSPGFGGNNGDDVQKVRVVNSGNDWDEIVEKIKSLVDDWRAAVKQFADSTAALMTDDQLSNLTQAEQLAFAKSQVEDLAAKAQAGDIEALGKLEQARAEYLKELRESEGAGFGFDKGWDWVMGLTADVLENAQTAENNMIAIELAKTVEAWAYVMDKLAQQLEAAFYLNTQDLIDAIYNAIGGVPGFASGGVVMRGPRIVRVAEYIPEAIVPLDRLASMVPYPKVRDGMMSGGNRSRQDARSDFYRSLADRDALARLSSVELTSTQTARALASIKNDISAIRRRT